MTGTPSPTKRTKRSTPAQPAVPAVPDVADALALRVHASDATIAQREALFDDIGTALDVLEARSLRGNLKLKLLVGDNLYALHVARCAESTELTSVDVKLTSFASLRSSCGIPERGDGVRWHGRSIAELTECFDLYKYGRTMADIDALVAKHETDPALPALTNVKKIVTALRWDALDATEKSKRNSAKLARERSSQAVSLIAKAAKADTAIDVDAIADVAERNVVRASVNALAGFTEHLSRDTAVSMTRAELVAGIAMLRGVLGTKRADEDASTKVLDAPSSPRPDDAPSQADVDKAARKAAKRARKAAQAAAQAASEEHVVSTLPAVPAVDPALVAAIAAALPAVLAAQQQPA